MFGTSGAPLSKRALLVLFVRGLRVRFGQRLLFFMMYYAMMGATDLPLLQLGANEKTWIRLTIALMLGYLWQIMLPNVYAEVAEAVVQNVRPQDRGRLAWLAAYSYFAGDVLAFTIAWIVYSLVQSVISPNSGPLARYGPLLLVLVAVLALLLGLAGPLLLALDFWSNLFVVLWSLFGAYRTYKEVR